MNIEDTEWDAAIVGAGVAGALVAWKLAARGLKVLVLEAGPEAADRTRFVGQFARARDKIPSSPYAHDSGSAQAPIPRETDKDNGGHYIQTGPDDFKSTYLRLGGGSTWHWLGNVPRLIPNDFRMRSVFGVASDWPISYDELEGYYTQAEAQLGVAGEASEWSDVHGAWRSAPFPMPGIWPVYGDSVVRRRLGDFEHEGHPIRLRVTPQARNSVPYQGRPPCAGNSSCVPICPIGAKYDATVHLKLAAQASGKGGLDAAIAYQCVARKLVVTPEGKVERLLADRWSGDDRSTVEIRARRYILAAHAIETPLILLESGLGGDAVGRNLMDHPQGYGVALMPEPVFPFRGPPVTSGVDVFRDGEFRSQRAAFRVSIGNDGWGRMQSLDETVRRHIFDMGLTGEALRKALNERVIRMIRLSYSTEMLPDPANRVSIGGHDAKGNPKPRIEFQVPHYNLAAFEYAQALFRAMFERMGATEIGFSGRFSGAGHIMGTCRMGSDPATSVVDSHGQLHGVPDVHVVGASTFTTGGTANPTLTAAALALRTADLLMEE